MKKFMDYVIDLLTLVVMAVLMVVLCTMIRLSEEDSEAQLEEVGVCFETDPIVE